MPIKLSFPEFRGEAMFKSPKELFISTFRLFNKMLQKLRKSKSSSGDRSLRRRKVANTQAGRKMRLIAYRPDQNILAPYETILYSLLQRNSLKNGKRFLIPSIDFLGWERQVQQSLTLMLTVDVSRSTLAYKEMFATIIRNLSAHFNRHHDRVGLISVSGKQAEILNHPSRNHRIVARSMMQLTIKGETPLGDGLIKSLEMVKLEKTRNPGSKPVVILLSDCFPEPITHQYKDVMDEPIYRHAIAAAEMFRRRRVSLIVINPSYRSENFMQATGAKYRKSPGEKLSDEIVRRSDGHMIKLKTQPRGALFSDTKKVIDQSRQIRDILESIESVFTGTRGRHSDGVFQAS